MSTPNQYAIREVALATFYSLSTNKALFHLQNLKSSGLENSADTVYARGGRGNGKIVGFSSNREGKVSLEDALFTNEALAMMTGNDLVEGTQNVYKRDVVTVESNAAVLTKTPVGALISVYKLNADGTHGEELTLASGTLATGQYEITGKDITFFASDIADGGQVAVYYNIATDTSAKKITISSDKFAGAFKLVLDCLVRDAITQEDFEAQIIVHSARMENGWSISMSSDGDPSTFTMPIEILKPVNGTDMWTMTIYDDSAIA